MAAVEGTATVPTHLTLQSPRVPRSFHGDLYEDVEDWLDDFERVADCNEWDDRAKLKNAYFSLEDGARTWFQNREEALTSWRELCRRLLDTYSSPDRRERAERALQSRAQKPNESVLMYVEDMTRLFRRADPSMPEDKKLRHLMRGVKEQLFGGLVRNPPRTVTEFLAEAVAMEKALQQRSNQYDRQVNAASTTIGLGAFATDIEVLRELIRSVVRDELQQLHRAQQPTVNCIADIVRDEVQHALGVPQPRPERTPQASEFRRTTYADALRRSLPASATYPLAATDFERETYGDTLSRSIPASAPPSPVALHSAQAVPYFPDNRPVTRKSDIWRMPDRRPLCYHCGEAGHVYRECHYRQLGLQGYAANSPRPRFGQRPPEIEAFIAQQRAPQSPRRQSRSPSPRRSYPSREGTSRVTQGRSPSPRLEN